MGNIDQKIFTPIKKELSPLFNDFNIKKIKKGRGQGGKVVQLQFTFKEKDQVPLNNWLKG
ncbi:Protein involved in initiation of plasmid replication [Streptococcus pneumoniae]|nr:Protein involved in initiation of plasmid replication [Streptococcus pneumoniae]